MDLVGELTAKIILDNSDSEVCIVEEGAFEVNKINMGRIIKRYRFGGAEIAFGKPNISIAEEKQLEEVLRLTVIASAFRKISKQLAK